MSSNSLSTLNDDTKSISGYSDATDATNLNEISDGADRVKVAVRVRPFTSDEKAKNLRCIIKMASNSTDVLDPTFYSGEMSHDLDEGHYTRRFNFDHSFWSHEPEDPNAATQAIVFNALGTFLLDNALRGYNCSLFAYGQTGSGKTHTMIGSEGGSSLASENENGNGNSVLDMSELGVVPRLCKMLFERVKQHSQLPPPPPLGISNGGAGATQAQTQAQTQTQTTGQTSARDGRLVRAGVVVQVSAPPLLNKDKIILN